MASRSPVVRRHVIRTAPALGRSALLASAYPRMGSGIYLALGVVALHGLGLTPVALVVAGLVVATVAFASAEGASVFPEAGGSAALARHAMNELASFVDGLGDVPGARRDGGALGAVRGPLPERLLGSARVRSMVHEPATLHRDRPRGGPRSPLGIGSRRASRPSPASSTLVVQLLLVLLGVAFVFHPEAIQQNVHLGDGAVIRGAGPGLRAGARRLHGHRGDRRDGGRCARPRARPGAGLGRVGRCGGLGRRRRLARGVDGRDRSSGRPAAATPRLWSSPRRTATRRIPCWRLRCDSAARCRDRPPVSRRAVRGHHARVRRVHGAHGLLRALAAWLARHHQLPALSPSPTPASRRRSWRSRPAGQRLRFWLPSRRRRRRGDAGRHVRLRRARSAFTSVHGLGARAAMARPGPLPARGAPLNLPVDGRRIPLTAVLGGASARRPLVRSRGAPE